MESDYGLKNQQIAVEEITKPELSPEVMCNRMASHLERGTAFRRATMWTIQQIMEGGAMGTEITISGKLRGDRSAFEKHSQGILPRAGHHADVIVAEDIAHVETPMGLIGVRIRIARKERFVPEFELRGKSQAEKDEEARMKKDRIRINWVRRKENRTNWQYGRRWGDDEIMAMLKMKSIRELNEKDLRDRIEQMKTELSKLQTENAKGTLRKETGKIRKVKKEVARLMTRLNEVKKQWI